MIEQRCDHGFLRSVVPCSTCDAERYRFKKGDAPGEGRHGQTSVGSRIAGILVIEVIDKTFITAQCGCGSVYRTHRSTVTGCAARGKNARCRACICAARNGGNRAPELEVSKKEGVAA